MKLQSANGFACPVTGAPAIRPRRNALSWGTVLRFHRRRKETFMRDRLLNLRTVSLLAMVAFGAGLAVSIPTGSAEVPESSAAALKTPLGEPDLQGIWTDESDTPLQRPARYANQE